MTDSERRYSDEEFALIIRKASQPLDPASPSTPATEATGLTLDEIRAIAADVGLDPQRVAAAAASIPATGDGTQDPSLLGEARYQLQVEVPRQIPEDDLVEIFEVARQQLGQRGSLNEVMGSLEWSSQDDVVQYHVSLKPKDGRTRITVGVERTAAALLTGVFSGVGWLIATGATGAALEPGLAGGLALGAAGIGGALATMKTLARITAGRTRKRAERLMSALAEKGHALTAAAASAEVPGDDPEA